VTGARRSKGASPSQSTRRRNPQGWKRRGAALKPGARKNENRKVELFQTPVERESLTGQNQVSSRNNITCHKLQSYGSEGREPEIWSQDWVSGCFFVYFYYFSTTVNNLHLYFFFRIKFLLLK